MHVLPSRPIAWPLSGWRLFVLLCALVLVLSAVALLAQPDRAEGVRAVIRTTARTSFVLFVVAFAASSLASRCPAPLTRALVRERRMLGLAFAFSHLLHLVAIAGYGLLDAGFWAGRSALSNASGAAVYGLIAAMTLTSFPFFARRLTRAAWRRLHTTGMWAIAATFAMAYAGRVAAGGAGYVLPLAVLCAAIALRGASARAASVRARHAERRTEHAPDA